MKNLLLFLITLLLFISELKAQVPNAMPPDANDFYNNSMPLLRPQVKNFVLQVAKSLKHRKANADSLSKSLKKDVLLKGMNDNDIEGIVVLIMVQASKDADADLKNIVMGISRANDQKHEKHAVSQSIAAKNDGSKEETNELQNVQLQSIMNHKSYMAEEVTYMMKKISGTQQDIINNLR